MLNSASAVIWPRMKHGTISHGQCPHVDKVASLSERAIMRADLASTWLKVVMDGQDACGKMSVEAGLLNCTRSNTLTRYKMKHETPCGKMLLIIWQLTVERVVCS